MALTGQKHYPSCSLRRKGGDRGSDDPPGNGRHYPHSSSGGCDGPHGTQDGGPSDDPYRGGSDISSSFEFGG